MYDHGKSYIYETYKTYPILSVYFIMLSYIIVMIIVSNPSLISNEVLLSFMKSANKTLLLVLDDHFDSVIPHQSLLIHYY